MDEAKFRVLSEQLRGCFAGHEAAAAIHVEPLARQFFDNPDAAIDSLFRVYNRALDDAYTDDNGKNMRAFIEAIAGGPCEVVPWALYNAVGAVYPYLERNQKDRALSKIVHGILDQRNYIEVNGGNGAGHTTGIREPLLLSDIGIVRRLYWPGVADQKDLWQKCANFDEFRVRHMNDEGMFLHDGEHSDNLRHPVSDFLVAYGLLRNDFSKFGEDYARVANPEFLTRLLKGIVGMRFAKTDETEIVAGEKRLRELLPAIVHDRITPLRLEGGWVDSSKFR